MSIMDAIFGNRTPAPAPAPAPGPAPAPIPNPAPAANQNIPGVDPNNPTLPAGHGTPANPNPQDPFKDFDGIWQIDPTKLDETKPFFATVNPADVMASAAKANFMQMTPEQKAAIEAGGPQAFGAMQQILNKAVQTVYGQSALATGKMIDNALAAFREQSNKQLPTLINKHQTTQLLAAENPLFTNPNLAPMVEGLKTQFLAKYPTATAEEIKQQVVQYMNTIGAQFAPAPVQTGPKPPAETDWSKFFE